MFIDRIFCLRDMCLWTQACMKATIVALMFNGKIFNIISEAKGKYFILFYIYSDCSIRVLCPCCDSAYACMCVVHNVLVVCILNHMFICAFRYQILWSMMSGCIDFVWQWHEQTILYSYNMGTSGMTKIYTRLPRARSARGRVYISGLSRVNVL